MHCIDLPFAWDLLDADGVETVAGSDPPPALAECMHRAWVSFVVDGDPGWPAFRLSSTDGDGDGEIGPRATMRFDQTSEVVADLLGPERGRWP